jgi:hypothetical protein
MSGINGVNANRPMPIATASERMPAIHRATGEFARALDMCGDYIHNGQSGQLNYSDKQFLL